MLLMQQPPDLYKCVSQKIMSEQVIITENQVIHIKEKHPGDYEKYEIYLKDFVENPDYIVETERYGTALVLKRIEDKRFKVILRLVTEYDNVEYKNSIITFMRINQSEWNRLLRKRKILYKNE